MPESNKNSLEAKLQSVIETIDVAAALTAPLTQSIENLLKVSAAALKSEEASVIVRDGEQGDLKFLTAIGKVADRLTGVKIPAGKGIAGFVFASGQPLAIADAGREKSFYPEVDKQTGYSTQAILATPLRYSGEIIGVLEFVNRTGEPPFEAFTPLEMDQAALFADAVAALVNAFETAAIFRQLADKMLAGETANLSEIRTWLAGIRGSAEHREMLDLAILVREIAARGAAERRLCREILEAFARFSEDDAAKSFLSF